MAISAVSHGLLQEFRDGEFPGNCFLTEKRYIGSWAVISKNVAEVFSHDRYQTTGKSAASLLGNVNRERRVRLHGSSPLEPSLGAGCPIPGTVEIDELMSRNRIGLNTACNATSDEPWHSLN
ncbi:hypothetical protein VTI28DRAFT_8549 [Corynascus sepedonium]